jgi:hypothetical protein
MTVVPAEFGRPQSAFFELCLTYLPLRRFRFGISGHSNIPTVRQKSPATNRWGW